MWRKRCKLLITCDLLVINLLHLDIMGGSRANRGRVASVEETQVEAFIVRWQGREGGQERANYDMFLREFAATVRTAEVTRTDGGKTFELRRAA